MSKLEAIQEQILELTQVEINALDTWLNQVKQALWDEQFAEDVHAGRLDMLGAKAKADFEAGRFRKL